MKKKSVIITLVVFFTCFLFSCGKAPNTAKVLRGLNNAKANYWAELVQKNGVGYVDYDGENIIALALEAENATLLKAIIKDGANLYRRYENSNGVEKYPLEFVILGADQYYNQFVPWELAKILIDAGTELQYSDPDILLRAWYYENTELVDFLLPGFKKQKLLDYSYYEDPEALKMFISATRNKSMLSRLNKLAEAGIKLPKDLTKEVVEEVIYSGETLSPEVIDFIDKAANISLADINAIIAQAQSRPVFIAMDDLWLFKEPIADYYNRIGETLYRGSKVTLLEVGKEETQRGYFYDYDIGESYMRYVTAPWFLVRDKYGKKGWLFSGYLMSEEDYQTYRKW